MNPLLLRSARFAKRPVLLNQSDERLAELAREGSHDAFEAIVARHRPGLVRHCARLVGEADAEEAVQESLVKAHAALATGNHVCTVGAWLRTIAHNTALSMLRARAVRPVATDRECECTRQTTDSYEAREELRDVLEAVASLPDRQREALVMRELEGRSYEEIAETLGATDGAVRGLLGRARVALRDRIAALPGLEPVLRWFTAAGGNPGAARIGSLSGGCALTIKVCAAMLPAVPAGIGALSIVPGGSGSGSGKATAPARTSASVIRSTTATTWAGASTGAATRRAATSSSTSSTAPVGAPRNANQPARPGSSGPASPPRQRKSAAGSPQPDQPASAPSRGFQMGPMHTASPHHDGWSAGPGPNQAPTGGAPGAPRIDPGGHATGGLAPH